MTNESLLNMLNEDLSREYAHMLFYLNASIRVAGLHRPEYQEFFMKAAASEMDHVSRWGCMIQGLGGIPTTKAADYRTDLTGAEPMVLHAIALEEEVVKNYVEQIDLISQSQHPDAKWIELFLEDQIVDSRTDLDNLRRMAVKFY